MGHRGPPAYGNGGGGGGGGSTLPAAPGADGQYALVVLGGVASWQQITSDMVKPGITVTITGSGNGTFECGATWNTTPINATPAPNAGGVTAAHITDTDGGNSNVLGQSNPIASPSASYTKTASGATESLQYTVTDNGITKSSNLLTSTWIDRWYVGQSTTGDATGATTAGAPANDALLTGGSGTTGPLAGTLALFPVGSSFNIPASGTPVFTYLLVLHTATAMQFTSGGAPFPMTRVTSGFSFTNQEAVAHSFDLYASNPTTQAFTVTRSV